MPRLADVQRRIRDAMVTGDPTAATPLFAGTDPARRLAIHLRHYESSLVTALADRFPATGWLAGASLVREAARGFVRHYPPAAPCIAEYGERFPDFLAGWPGAARLPYLRDFAELDWHLGRIALSIDHQALARRDLEGVDGEEIAGVAVAVQGGLYYAHAHWPVDELMTLYLTDAAPDRWVLAATEVWIEVRGARGSFQFSRLDAGDFAFRTALREGRSFGEAAQRALDADSVFDPGRALSAVLDGGLATSIIRMPAGVPR